MTTNLFQRGEDIQFYVDPTKIEGYTDGTDIRLVLCPVGLDFGKESSRDKIVALEPVTDDGNIVFTATSGQTATMQCGDYNVELVYTIDGLRSICKSERAFTLEDSATNHLTSDGDGDND